MDKHASSWSLSPRPGGVIHLCYRCLLLVIATTVELFLF